MKENLENYSKLILIGLVLTLIVVAALLVYSLAETNRLASAAEEHTQERVARGGEFYQAQCVSCHGAQGEGGIGPALNNRTVLKNTLDNVFFSVIRSGVPGTQMPAWSVDFGGPLTDEDVRDLVAFVRAWEPTAPEILPIQFVPDAKTGARLFASTCAMCHGENGSGGDIAPRINDLARLASLPDEWYRGVINNGRPAKGMPTWGTVLSPNQVEDLVALVAAWRRGEQVQPDFTMAELLDNAVYSLGQADPQSAALAIQRAIHIASGTTLQNLQTAADQITAGDLAAAQQTITALKAAPTQGDPTAGAGVYTAQCAACHGPQGEGGIGPALVNNLFIQSQSETDLRQFILDGRPGTAMAGFLNRLDDTQLADMIAFLRLWQAAP